MGNGDPQHLSDEDLVERIRGGESQGKNILFLRYRPQLYRFFSSKIPPDDAEDLAQKASECLRRRLEGVKPIQGSFRSFAFGVGRRILLRYLSDRAKGRNFDPDVHTLADLDPTISSQVSKNRHFEWLRAALEQLPISVVSLLELRYVQELTYAEIARIHGLPAGTVVSRVRLAKEKLARMRPTPKVTS